jgi:hypothetical protein
MLVRSLWVRRDPSPTIFFHVKLQENPPGKQTAPLKKALIAELKKAFQSWGATRKPRPGVDPGHPKCKSVH